MAALDERTTRRPSVEPPATEEVRLTLKGAALSTWGNMWPLEQIADWRARRRAKRVRRELGL